MEITVLGSGTVTPSLKRNASGLVVRTSEAWVLVDMGPGTIRRMCEAGIDYRNIDVILVTHFHPDHVSDLVPFLFASNYDYEAVREERFHLVGPTGMEQFYEAQVGMYGDWIVPKGDRLVIREMDARQPDTFEIEGLWIRSRPAAHTFPSLSYRIEADGSSVTVTGDTDVSDDLVHLARGTDLLVCESSMPDDMKVRGHLVPSEAGRIASSARAKRLLLTHFYPPCDEVDVVSQAAAVFSGEIFRAEDLMVLRV
ncbi:MAG: MBL fold metallo-hydrolase [Desulfomonilaceae bacterium]|nr:MBL fold metallo-hydrolase [Desulfomonilaceae bacterium]